jgi:Mrp family chromosome partitioning ATPase
VPRQAGFGLGTVSVAGPAAREGKAVMKPVTQQIGDGTLRIVSMGSIARTNETEAIMWRGLMLNRAVQPFFEDVQWVWGSETLSCLVRRPVRIR